ncbi:MAG: four helix bundle protein [Bacteroidales bacterium]|nr:four helix bundle protein [Bacteroidales bacterium]
MKDDNAIKTKSEDFAVRIVGLYKYLVEKKSEYVMSKQMLRSGTSVGANISEALCGISRKDFLSKMYIAFKECNETKYWITLLYRTDYISEKEKNSIMNDCEEMLRMLSSITKTTSGSINSKFLIYNS